MRNRRATTSRLERDEEANGWISARLPFLRSIGWGPRDAIAFTLGAIGSVAILVNALFLQSGPHPAPLFKAPLAPAAAADTTNTVAVPRARPQETAAAKVEPPAATVRTPAEIMTELQRELARRGLYDGPIDGMHGPKTDAAIRDFELAAGMKPNLQASEALLQAMVKSSIEAPKAAAATPASTAGAGHNDAIADMLASSHRVMALQRALAQYGYGQIKPTGVVDADTRAAIEKFERERRLPITGQPSDRVLKELAGLVGRPLD